MSVSAPLCRYCGKAVAKSTRTIWLRTKADVARNPHVASSDLVVDQLPQTIDACRKLTNRHVVSVKRNTPDRGGAIYAFGEWDGESYKDSFFCSGDHAQRFGYAAARSGQASLSYSRAKQERAR